MSPLSRALLALLLLAPLSACDSDPVDPPAAYVGAVYVQSNETVNRIVAYGRTADGALERIADYPTGGAGTNGLIVPMLDRVTVDPLFSDDSVVLSADRSLLFTVNASSGSVTSFRVAADFTLQRADTESTGGSLPVTLTYRNGFLYAGNVNNPMGGRPSTVAGFRVAADGALTPIAGLPRAVSSVTGQVSHVLFSPDGRFVMAAQLMADTVSAFAVGADGALAAPRASRTAPGTFGLGFFDATTLVSTDVGPPMTPGSSTASTYRVGADGGLTLLSSVGNGQNAACWIAFTPDRRFAYVTNTSSGTVSLYSVASDGQFALVEAVAASQPPAGGVDVMGVPSSGPADTFVSADGQYFYQQWTGRGTVGAYRIGADGRLTATAEFGRGDVLAVGSEGMDGF